MAEIFKFFNSAPGDERWHYASDFADYFGSVLSSGLISNGNSPVGLQVTVNSGTMTTSVNVGRALIKGYSYENTTPLTLTHSIPEQTLDRIDRVVLRLDLKNASRFIKVFVKEGVSALEPIPPTLQRDQYIYELSLAQVRIRKNTSSIVVSDIKDERADENLCGIVQSLITVPTSVFQQQFDTWFSNYQTTSQSDFTVWFDSIKGQLDGDVGAKLASDLSSHKLDLVSHGIYGVATGTNALVMTDSKVTQYVDGMLVAFKNTTASTAATTLNINNLGAKAILKANGTAVNNLKTNAIYQLRYNGVNFILLGEGGEYGNVTASDVLAGKTFGTENGLMEGIATIASLGGKKWASGNLIYPSTLRKVEVLNLGFSPSSVFIELDCTSVDQYTITALINIPNFVNNRFYVIKNFNNTGEYFSIELLTDGFSFTPSSYTSSGYEMLNRPIKWYAFE